MNNREFFYLVCNMRRAQRNYFKEHSNMNLRIARALENDVDREIRRVESILENSVSTSQANPE